MEFGWKWWNYVVMKEKLYKEERWNQYQRYPWLVCKSGMCKKEIIQWIKMVIKETCEIQLWLAVVYMAVWNVFVCYFLGAREFLNSAVWVWQWTYSARCLMHTHSDFSLVIKWTKIQLVQYHYMVLFIEYIVAWSLWTFRILGFRQHQNTQWWWWWFHNDDVTSFLMQIMFCTLKTFLFAYTWIVCLVMRDMVYVFFFYKSHHKNAVQY